MQGIIKNIIIIICILFLQCSDDGPLFIQVPQPKNEIKLEIFPKAVFVGYKIRITAPDSIEFLHVITYPTTLFPDSTNVYADSVIKNNIYLTVPYTYKSGPLTVKTPTKQYLTEPLTIINDCQTGNCVKNWNLNYSISKEDSYDHFTGTGWLYKLMSDTVCISLEASGPNHTIRQYLYFEEDSLLSLPRFLGGDYFIFTTGLWRYEIDSAIVEIYHWNENGTYAGKIFSTPSKYNVVSDVFWADSLKE
jgi:hypothetical protein